MMENDLQVATVQDTEAIKFLTYLISINDPSNSVDIIYYFAFTIP